MVLYKKQVSLNKEASKEVIANLVYGLQLQLPHDLTCTLYINKGFTTHNFWCTYTNKEIWQTAEVLGTDPQ